MVASFAAAWAIEAWALPWDKDPSSTLSAAASDPLCAIIGRALCEPALCSWPQHPMQTSAPTCPDARGSWVSLTLGPSNLSEISLSPPLRVCTGLGPWLVLRDLACTELFSFIPFSSGLKRVFFPLRRSKYFKNLIIFPLGYGLKKEKENSGILRT